MLWDWPGLTGLPEIRQGRQHPESLPCPGRTNPAIVSNVRMTDIRMEIGITNLNLSWISWIPQWLADLKLQNPMVHELITPWPSKPPQGSRCGYLFNISVPVVEWNSLKSSKSKRLQSAKSMKSITWLGNSILSSNCLCMANREWITIGSNPQNHEAKTTFPNCEERPAAPETLTGKSRSSSGYVASLQCLIVALSVQSLLKVGGCTKTGISSAAEFLHITPKSLWMMDLRCVVAVLSKIISLGRPWDHWVSPRPNWCHRSLRNTNWLHKTNQPFAYHVNVWVGICGWRMLRSLWSMLRVATSRVTGKDIPILIFLSTVVSTIPELIITNRSISIPIIFCKRWSKIQFYIVLLFFLPIQFFLDQGRSPLPMASPWQSCARSWSWSCTSRWLWFFRGQPPKKSMFNMDSSTSVNGEKWLT